MIKKIVYKSFALLVLFVFVTSCKIQQHAIKTESKKVPVNFDGYSSDSTSIAKLNWREYFADENLIALIDTAFV